MKIITCDNQHFVFYFFQQIQVHTVVVIHPGSLNLRIGRASDTFPVTVHHCLARLKKNPGSSDHVTPWMFRAENKVTAAASLNLTHYQTMPHFDTQKIYSCRKHCEKRRNYL